MILTYVFWLLSSSYIVGQELAHITDGQTKAECLNGCDTEIWSNVLGKNTGPGWLVGLADCIDWYSHCVKPGPIAIESII